MSNEIKIAGLPGLKVTPEYYGTPAWESVMGGMWIGLINYAIGQKQYREAFEKETGLSLSKLANRNALDAMIDKATGHEAAVMAAWCDWVTKNLWGEKDVVTFPRQVPFTHPA